MSDSNLEQVTKKVQTVIDEIINPKLQEHNGWIELVEVDLEERAIVVRFRGACSSCAGVDDTMENTIIPLIRQNVREIRNVELTDELDQDIWDMAKSLFTHKEDN